VEVRAGENVLEYVDNGPAAEPLFYLWLAAFEQARAAAAALDSVAAAAPDASGAGAWSADERAAFRRGLVRTAVAAAAARAHVEYAVPFTVALTSDSKRARMSTLLDRRAEWLRDRLAGTADFAATAAACPDTTPDAFRACLDPDGEDLQDIWRDIGGDIEGALRILDQLMFSEGAPVLSPSGGLFGGLWDDPRAVGVYYLWTDVFDEIDRVTEGLGFAAGVDPTSPMPDSPSSGGPPPDEVRYGLGSAATAAATAREVMAEATWLTTRLAARRTPEGLYSSVPPAHLLAALDDVLQRTAALASDATCTDAGACGPPTAPAVWAALLAEVLADAGALETALTGQTAP
jgi:hypothetical protein